MGDDIDIYHEGRIVSLEVKMDRALPLIEDLHADMRDRKARWAIITNGIRYSAWISAGVATLLGFSKSESVASWLNAFPH